MIRPNEDMLRALAAGLYPPTDAEARAMAAEVLRLRAAVRAWAEADDAVTAAEPLDALDAMERRAAAGLRLHVLALEVGR